jgi:hypothetical protein
MTTSRVRNITQVYNLLGSTLKQHAFPVDRLAKSQAPDNSGWQPVIMLNSEPTVMPRH